MLAPGAIVDPEDLRVPGEQPGTPIVVIDDLGQQVHGHRYRARQGKSLLLLTVLAPEVTMQRELRDLLNHRMVQMGEVLHPSLLPTYGAVRLPIPDEDLETFFIVRPDPGCPTLRQWLHEVWHAGHTLDPLNAVAIAVQICEALAAVHEHCAHGFVTLDNVFMYPTGGMPQALLASAGEGGLVPFAPEFDRFVRSGFLPMAGAELFEPPHEPRVETDVLGVAALVLEVLSGQPLEPGMPLERFGLPPRLRRLLEVASRPDPEDRPQNMQMFSRRLQAAVGLGEDPVEPSAVLEPAQHGEHADPRYPAVRARPWRPPPPPAPPWADAATPTSGSGAWNVGAPTPGSGSWNVGAPAPGSGAWARHGSGAWAMAAPQPTSGQWNPTPPSGQSPWAAQQPRTPPPPPLPTSEPPPPPPKLGTEFPAPGSPDPSSSASDRYDFDAPTPPGQPDVVAPAPVTFGGDEPSVDPFRSREVSIMMPAPDGSVMASFARGAATFTIRRRGKQHGPYTLAQLEQLIPMAKLRSVDTVVDSTTGMQALAVDVPGLRPLFEARAREVDMSVMRPMPQAPTAVLAADPTGPNRSNLWLVIGLLAAAVLAAVAFLALR